MHRTTKAPRPHPTGRECSPPPLGGGVFWNAKGKCLADFKILEAVISKKLTIIFLMLCGLQVAISLATCKPLAYYLSCHLHTHLQGIVRMPAERFYPSFTCVRSSGHIPLTQAFLEEMSMNLSGTPELTCSSFFFDHLSSL